VQMEPMVRMEPQDPRDHLAQLGLRPRETNSLNFQTLYN